MRDLWQRILQTSGAQIYSLLGGLITLTLTARWLGPEGRGTIATVTTWMVLFATVGNLSLGQVVIYRATILRGQAWLGPTLGSLLLLDGIITMTGWLIAAGLFTFTDTFRGLSLVPLAVGFLALPFFLAEQYGGGLLVALSRINIYNTAVIIGRSANVALVFTAWRLYPSVTGVLVATLVGQTTVSGFMLRFLWHEAGGLRRPEMATIVGLLKGSAKLHVNSVAALLISSSSILIISHDLGSVATGHYQAATQLIQVPVLMLQAASMVAFGRAVQLGPDAAWILQRRLLVHLLVVMTCLSVLAAVVAPWIIPLVLGARFEPSVRLFRILLLTMFGATLGWGMTSQWITRGMFLSLAFVTVTSGIATLVANLLLVPRFGVEAAAWVSVAGYGMVTVGQGWMVWHCERSMRRSTRRPRSAPELP